MSARGRPKVVKNYEIGVKRKCLTNTIKIGVSKKREKDETHTQQDEIQLWDEKHSFGLK